MVRLSIPSLVSLFLLISAPTSAEKHLITERAYSRATRLLQAEAAATAALPDPRPGGAPIFKLHPPGSFVHGTVVLYHGYAGNAATSALQASFFFNAGFNVYAVTLAGFAQTVDNWPATTLRSEFGYKETREALLSDSSIRFVIDAITNDTSLSLSDARNKIRDLVPLVKSVVEKKMSPTSAAQVREAFDLLSPFVAVNSPTFAPKINKYFFTDHVRHEIAALTKLGAVQPLPGPLFVLGMSFGGPSAMVAAAHSRAVKRAVLLAPAFSSTGERADVSHFFSIAGALDLFNTNVFGQTLLTRATTAVFLFIQSILRDDIFSAVRETTRTLCILAEDDGVIDVPKSKEICTSKIGGRSLMYPARLGIGHFLTPESGNNYSDAMMRQVASFFINGTADEASLLRRNS